MKIKDYLNKSSKFLIDWCLENELNTIIIGYNEFWKTEINIGKKITKILLISLFINWFG